MDSGISSTPQSPYDAGAAVIIEFATFLEIHLIIFLS
jgi:hypothetical protein